ncbi:hypothetical protein JKF63_03361 [Porcisia hertigi]|uniref:Uncharacterized protein n=1 Tax=Porcisia hertigi TaxID=2761500 RepID=A0A836L994_9TRYP|nr:hypothetical protein JKF63_03361 [Porcisia hertigi]
MGNRIFTSASPFSLEDLEASAHALSFLDLIPRDAASLTGSQQSLAFRKEMMRVDFERQFTDYDTSLHVLRCTRDRSGTRHRIGAIPTTSKALPGGGEPQLTPGQGWNRKPADKSGLSLVASAKTCASGPAGELLHSPHEYNGSRQRGSNGMSGNGDATAPLAMEPVSSLPKSNDGSISQRHSSRQSGAAPASVSLEMQLSPRSWLFREVSVQPVDLTRCIDLKAAEVYILIIVQRATMSAPPLTSTLPAKPSAGLAGTRAATQLPSVPPAYDGARSEANSASMGATANPEWPRDMLQLFTPRGLSAPFSSDMTRPILVKGNHGLGAGFWGSPYSTPRTNGATSGRPTPRSTTTAAAAAAATAATSAATGSGGESSGISHASPRSASSQATPRTSDFQFSVHLLTGKQADAITAAAGLFTARAIERLFLDCADFDRRLFYNLSTTKIDAITRARTTNTTRNITPACRGSGGDVVHSDAENPSTSSPQSPNASGGAVASLTRIAGNTKGRGSSDSNGDINHPISSLQHLKSALEVSTELWRELLAVTRPASVAVPVLHCNKRSSTAAPLTASLPSTGSHPGAFGSSNDHATSTVVSPNLAELYSLNAVFRVLNGVRVGTPRWMHSGDVISPLNSARYSVPGSGSAAVTGGSGTGPDPLGTGSWHYDPLPSLRPSRRNVLGDGAVTSVTATSSIVPSIPSLNISSWLQGPQPLDLHRAAPAASTATRSPGSAHSIRTGSMTLRLGRPPRHAWDPTSSSPATPPPPPPPPPTPTPALGTPCGHRRVVSTTPLDPVGTSPTPSTSAGSVFSFPLNTLGLPSSHTANVNACLTLHSASVKKNTTPASPSPHSAPLAPQLQSFLDAEKDGEAAAQPTSDILPDLKISFLPCVKEKTMQAGSRLAERHLPHTWHQPDHADSGVRDISASCDGAPPAPEKPPAEEEEEDYDEVQTQQERAQRLKAAQPEVTEISPRLYVGGEDAARDRAQLLRKGITHVVNTVSWCLDSFYPDLFRYLRLNLSDAADEPIFSLFPIVNAFIEDALERHQGRVFVHCQQGVSRSCTFVIAYVMWKQGLCYDRAYELVRERRRVCNPNFGFIMNLRLWEAQLSTPMLNSVFAYAPYTSSSPMPFSYQLTAYFDCATSSTVPGAIASRSSIPISVSPSCSAAERQAPGFLSLRDKEAHQQLRSDVLTRAIDMGGESAAHLNTLSLDPRLGYLFLFAPVGQAADDINSLSSGYADARRSMPKSQPRPRLSRGADGDLGESPADEKDTNVVTGCVVMGPECLGKAYSERALAACRRMLRFSFYHGEARTSITNAGKAVQFCPLLQVRLLPAVSMALLPRSSSLFPLPYAAMSLELTQRLLSRHLASPVRIQFARQSQWDVFFSNLRLGAMLSDYIAEEEQLESSEAVRRHAREKAAKASGASRRTRAAADHQSTSSGPPTMQSAALLPVSPAALRSSSSRSGRQTPRTPRQLHVSFHDNSSSFRRSGESERPAGNDTAGMESIGVPVLQSGDYAVTASAAAAASNPVLTTSRFPKASLLPIGSSVTAAGQGSKTGSAGTPLPLSGIPSLALASVADGGDRDKSRNASDDRTHAAVRMTDGESFAYVYPFTAATKVVIADLDDLEEDRCYVLGFQQRTGTSLYLWRGADAAESLTDVVHAFVQRMLASSEPEEGYAAVVDSLEAGKWTSCSIKLPDGSDIGVGPTGVVGKASTATEVLADVHVLYVEQGDEPREFLTLL